MFRTRKDEVERIEAFKRLENFNPSEFNPDYIGQTISDILLLLLNLKNKSQEKK